MEPGPWTRIPPAGPAADGFVLASGPDGVFRYSEGARAWTRLPGSDSLGQALLVPVGADLYAGRSIGIYRFKGWKGEFTDVRSSPPPDAE